ncbi:MAG: NAD/NADP octopine/nopaline dehydrogenase family protein [Muribaculaceae bacterium]|nr:NAD/NADP octopine/nopaline dehydrogenase family protein [Muribaculaceae bacterium]
MNVCICGGGSLGHTIVGFVASQEDYNVSVLTRHPEKWSKAIEVTDMNGHLFNGKLSCATNDPSLVVPNAHIVLLCLPGYAIKDTLQQIRPYLSDTTFIGTVVSSTGFFFMAAEVLASDISVFGFQRVPFIARTKEYGKSANLLGYKPSLSVAIENTADGKKREFVSLLERIFHVPVRLLGSHYEVSLTNSNPLLHTSRIYTMWKDWKPGVKYDRCPMFYADWTIDAAHYYIEMDREFQAMLKLLPVADNAIPNVLDYYESHDEQSLRNKLASIPAFKSLVAPMIGNDDDGYEPDFSSRYFTEDFPYGLYSIVKVARDLHFSTPIIDEVYNWGMDMIGQSSQ